LIVAPDADAECERAERCEDCYFTEDDAEAANDVRSAEGRIRMTVLLGRQDRGDDQTGHRHHDGDRAPRPAVG